MNNKNADNWYYLNAKHLEKFDSFEIANSIMISRANYLQAINPPINCIRIIQIDSLGGDALR